MAISEDEEGPQKHPDDDAGDIELDKETVSDLHEEDLDEAHGGSGSPSRVCCSGLAES